MTTCVSSATPKFLVILSPEIRRTLWRNLHTSRCFLFETHYDTLKVKRDSSSKEIRDSFLELSKQFHPDKNDNSPECNKQFIKLNEAYSVLSKPSSRSNYDLSLASSGSYSAHYHGTSSRAHRPFQDDSFWEQRDKWRDRFYINRPYYGIAGIKKMSNSWIVVFCIFFTLLGVGFQVFAIRMKE